MQSKLEMAATQQQESASEAALSPSERIETSVSNIQLTADPQETTVRTVDKVNHNQGSGPTDAPRAGEDSENAENKQARTTPGSQEASNQRLINTEREVR